MSGSRPPRAFLSSAFIAAISSRVRSKSKISMFAAMRSGRTDFGMTFNIPAKSGGFMLADEVTLIFEIEGIESR